MNDDNQQTVPLLGSSLNYSAGVPTSGENQQHVRIVNNLATATSKVIWILFLVKPIVITSAEWLLTPLGNNVVSDWLIDNWIE